MKFKNLKNCKRRGSALLVALLVMGVLMAVSLALSALIFRESRITKEFIDAGQAYYAAESAIELGLFGLKNNLPGWELTVDNGGYKSIEVDNGLNSVAELKVKNRCQAYPCFDGEFDITGYAGQKPAISEFYEVLDLNESITIPLFVVEGGKVKDISDFVVEFYAPFDPKTDLNVKPGGWELSGWDVLRWKVTGMTGTDGKNGDTIVGKPVTETISDFTAVSMNNVGGENFPSNAANPSWFGSVDCDDVSGAKRYSDDIRCAAYFIGTGTGKQIDFDPADLGQVSKIQAGTCSQMEGREYYQYQYNGAERDVLAISGCYSIGAFIENHTLNYLTLTNLVNPSVFLESKNEALSKLYFRVELFGKDDGGSSELKSAETVREYADLTANGYSGKSKQSINVKIKRDSFMPVFNFSLYSTYMSGKEDSNGRVHDDEYWYGKNNE